MKKINGMIILLLVTIISFGGIGFTSKVEASNNKPSVSAHAYVVMESKTGQVLLSQDENKKIYPASTVKMMTALIALENGNLSKRITITNQHLKNIPSDATMVGIKVGSTYTLDELMHMLLIYSGADAAQVIAYDIAGSPDEFIKLMNKKAYELKMYNTKFDNTIGLDIGDNYNDTYSTAKDMANLTKYVMKYSYIREVVEKPSYTIKNFNGSGSKTIRNTNRFLRDKWYPNDIYKIIGTKTGSTNAAGYVLATTAIDYNGREIICMFAGNSTSDKRYQDIEKLLTYTYKNIKIKTGWINNEGKWYYYDQLGNKLTNWQFINGSWYYLSSDGEMQTGWKFINGNWYYLESSGAMQTGWKFINGNWYYLESSGEMQTGWKFINGNWYYLESSGAMQTGWKFINGNWYYLESSGEMQTGWKFISGNWYYLESSGLMATNTIIDGWNIGLDGIAKMIV